jgi:RNA polymerase sigma-70 factor, ECF subfamily
MTRDNKTWLVDLHSEGKRRELAIDDLREIILRMLPKGLSRWLSPDNSHFEPFLQDVAQETLLRVLDHLDSFEGRSKFTTWVYTIAIRIALSELRLRKWQEVSLDKLEEGDQEDQRPFKKFANGMPGPEENLEQKQALMKVMKLIESELTPRQRKVMMAVNVHGVPMDVIAERMDSNRNAVYKMMHDARVKLKNRLGLEGMPLEDLLKMFSN